MMLAGTVAAAGSSKDSVKAVGAVSALGALTALTVDDYNKNLNRIENTKIFPASHLMSDNFIIPPGLFSKRWILLNTANHDKIKWIDSFNMTYETETGEKETVKITFRTNQNVGNWQYHVKRR